MAIDPRKRFRESPYGKTWHDAVAADWFQEGLQAAIASMALAGVDVGDGTQAAAAYFRMEGAKKLITTMMNLCEIPPEPKAPGMPANLKRTK